VNKYWKKRRFLEKTRLPHPAQNFFDKPPHSSPQQHRRPQKRGDGGIPESSDTIQNMLNRIYRKMKEWF